MPRPAPRPNRRAVLAAAIPEVCPSGEGMVRLHLLR